MALRNFEIKFNVKKNVNTIQEAKTQIKKEMKEKGIRNFQIKTLSGLRTLQQNATLHLYFTQVAMALNDKGFTAHKIIQPNIEMFWTPIIIKELWKKIQKTMYSKESTTKLKKIEEIDKIYDVFNKMLIERTGGEVSIPFPSIENRDLTLE